MHAEGTRKLREKLKALEGWQQPRYSGWLWRPDSGLGTAGLTITWLSRALVRAWRPALHNPRQRRPLPQQPHQGTLPEAVLSCRAGDRLGRVQARRRGLHDDVDDVDPSIEEPPSSEVPDVPEAPDAPEAPVAVPEERLSAASSQRQPLPQQPHHGTLPESRPSRPSRASRSAESLRMEESRRRPDASPEAAARHADTCESRDDALLVRSRSEAVVVWSAP